MFFNVRNEITRFKCKRKYKIEAIKPYINTAKNFVSLDTSKRDIRNVLFAKKFNKCQRTFYESLNGRMFV